MVKFKKNSKYHAQRTVINGIKFDSKREASRYLVLRDMEKNGEIEGLKLQVPYVLFEKSQYGRQIKYVADFVYVQNGKEVVEDSKGFRTDVYRLKKRLMGEIYGVVIKET